MSRRTAGFAESEDALARAIGDLWSELFGDPDLVVGPADNFFALGGSSLLAMRLLAELQRRLGIDLDLLALVEAATLRDLVALVAARGAVVPADGWEVGEIA